MARRAVRVMARPSRSVPLQRELGRRCQNDRSIKMCIKSTKQAIASLPCQYRWKLSFKRVNKQLKSKKREREWEKIQTAVPKKLRRQRRRRRRRSIFQLTVLNRKRISFCCLGRYDFLIFCLWRICTTQLDSYWEMPRCIYLYIYPLWFARARAHPTPDGNRV